MATDILSQSTSRGWSIVVTVDSRQERLRMLSAVNKAAANPRSVLRLWRMIVLERMKQRFDAEEGPGNTRWAPLSPLSTVPIREFRDVTRFGPPPRFGGRPAGRTLRSALQEYYNAWTSTGAGGTHRPTDAITTSSRISLFAMGVNHIAVVNEFRRTTKGAKGVAGKPVPARSIAYIRGDKRLLDRLVNEFVKYIENVLRRA